MMVPVMASRNLPTLVPPYFWITHPAPSGLPTRPGDTGDEDEGSDDGDELPAVRAGDDEDAMQSESKGCRGRGL